MNVQGIFSQLSTGHLSNLSISGEGSGEIVPSGRLKMTNYLNASLRKLHSRFLLREKELILQMELGRTKYALHSQHGAAHKLLNPTSTYPVYILDTLSPYQNDLIKVLEVFDIAGQKIPLNDTEHPSSVFTPRFNMLQVPESVERGSLSILYQAGHEPIEVGALEAAVDIPEALLGALQFDIASQVFTHMNGPDNSMKGQEFAASFEMECSGVIDNDLVNTSISTSNSKFDNRGFV